MMNLKPGGRMWSADLEVISTGISRYAVEEKTDCGI